jgi:hypothetical protein
MDAPLPSETPRDHSAAAPGRNAKRPITVLQVLPRLDLGGVERGALEIARAVVEAGGRALVASAGGRLGLRMEGFGAELIEGPYGLEEPRHDPAQRRRAGRDRPRGGGRHRPRPLARPGLVGLAGRAAHRNALRDHLARRLWRARAVQAALQFGHGQGAPGDRDLAVHRRAGAGALRRAGLRDRDHPPRRRSRAVHRGERRRRARHRAGAGLGRGRGSPPHRAAAGPAGLELEGAGRVRRRRRAAEGAARGRFHRADRRRRWRRRRRAAGRGGAGAGCARRGAGRARLRGHAGGLQALRRRGLGVDRAGSVRAGGGGGAGDGPPGGRDRPWRRARDGGAGRDRLALPARRRRGAGRRARRRALARPGGAGGDGRAGPGARRGGGDAADL